MSDFLPTLTATTASVTVMERPCGGFFQIAAWPETLPAVVTALSDITDLPVTTAPGGSVYDSELCVMAVAPGRFLLQCAAGQRGACLSALQASITDDLGAVTDLSDARSCFRLSGEAAALVLAKGMPLDLHASSFPVGKVVQSAIHEIAVVVRRARHNEFDIYGYRSFAQDLLHWLTVASR